MKSLRHALRTLLSKRGLLAVAVITLALGIGANTAIFSVVSAVLLRPLPYSEPARLVRVYSEFPTMDLRKFWMSAPEFLDIQKEAKSWESIGAFYVDGANVGTASEPIRVTAAAVTRSLIQALGVQPARGRNFSPQEDSYGGPRTVLITDGLWRRAFGADAGIIGKELQIDSRSYTVIGVMPPGFVFPAGSNDPVEVFATFQFNPASPGNRGGHYLSVIGKLRKGVSIQQTQDEMKSLMAGWKRENRAMHLLNPERHPVVMIPLHEDVVGSARPAILMLLGAVGFVLLIACVNVTNLLLARAESRRREYAMRLALGAGWKRLLHQFLTEASVLVLFGALSGILLSYIGLKVILAAAPDIVPRTGEIGIDPMVLLYTLGISVLAVFIFALVPLFQIRDHNLAAELRAAGQKTATGGGSHRFKQMLVIAQIALAVVPVIGSGLMIRGFWKLRHVDLGMNPNRVMAFGLSLPESRYEAPDRLRFANALQQKLASQPGVRSAAMASGLPPLRPINANDTDIEGYESTPEGPQENVDYWNVVTEDYFKTMGIRKIDGRLFERLDGAEKAQNVVVINQAMTRRFWKGNPIGKRVNPGSNDPPTWFTVIGVVEDTKNTGVDKSAGTELYFLLPQVIQFTDSNMGFVVRTDSGVSTTAAAIRSAVRDLDVSVPVYDLKTMSDIVDQSLVRPRFLSVLLGIFSIISLVLAAVGIYGVMAYTVAQETQEIGVRVALGATAQNVLAMVLRKGLRLTLIGLGAGLVGAFALTRLMESVLFDVSTTDPATFVMVAALLTAVGLLACFIPARRATKFDPIVALRYE
jgi:predicted permease